MSNSKVGPFGVCNLILKANSVLCVQCGKWIHGRYAGIKRVTQKFKKITCRKWKLEGTPHIFVAG